MSAAAVNYLIDFRFLGQPYFSVILSRAVVLSLSSNCTVQMPTSMEQKPQMLKTTLAHAVLIAATLSPSIAFAQYSGVDGCNPGPCANATPCRHCSGRWSGKYGETYTHNKSRDKQRLRHRQRSRGRLRQ